MSLTFIAGDGTQFPIDDSNGIRHMVGSTGFEAAPGETIVQARLSHDGDERTHARRPARTVLWPLFFTDQTARRQFTTAMVLTQTGPLGQVYDTVANRRLVDVMYVSGLEGDDSRDARLVDLWRKAVVELRCLDPYWYGPEIEIGLEVVAETEMDAALPMDEPIPMDGGAWFDLPIDGDVPPDGYVTLTGPITRYTFGDLRGTWNLLNPVAALEQVVIDSRPQSEIDWSLLDQNSVVNGIGVDNRVVIGASSSGAAAATFTYRPRWVIP